MQGGQSGGIRLVDAVYQKGDHAEVDHGDDHQAEPQDEQYRVSEPGPLSGQNERLFGEHKDERTFRNIGVAEDERSAGGVLHFADLGMLGIFWDGNVQGVEDIAVLQG